MLISSLRAAIQNQPHSVSLSLSQLDTFKKEDLETNSILLLTNFLCLLEFRKHTWWSLTMCATWCACLQTSRIVDSPLLFSRTAWQAQRPALKKSKLSQYRSSQARHRPVASPGHLQISLTHPRRKNCLTNSNS